MSSFSRREKISLTLIQEMFSSVSLIHFLIQEKGSYFGFLSKIHFSRVIFARNRLITFLRINIILTLIQEIFVSKHPLLPESGLGKQFYGSAMCTIDFPYKKPS